MIAPRESAELAKTLIEETCEKPRHRRWGVPHIWLVYSAQRSVSQFDGQSLLPLAALSLPQYAVSILAADLFNAP